MTNEAHGTSRVDYPSELEIVITRDFAAPLDLVFDVMTTPEHVNHWFAPFEDRMSVCTIDLRDGGDYHMVFVTPSGVECSFRGTYLEVTRPIRTVATWSFDGWPGVQATETVTLSEVGDGTRVEINLAFLDLEGRAHMTRTDGFEDTADKMEVYLRWLVHDAGKTVSE